MFGPQLWCFKLMNERRCDVLLPERLEIVFLTSPEGGTEIEVF